jgi:hypothetical protein
MRYLRILLNALVLPKLYIGYLLIRLAPNAAKDGVTLTETGYYTGVAVLLVGLLILFYGSFVLRRYKWLPGKTRTGMAWGLIAITVLVDSSIIYYLVSINGPDPEFFPLL